MVRVILADAHVLVRKQLAERLSREIDIKVVGQVTNAADMIERAHATRPDVLIIDPLARGEDFMAALKNLRFQLPDVGVIVLASVVDTFLQMELRRVGVHKILTKSIQTDQLLKEIMIFKKAR